MFFSNSGSEAIEGALKLARLYGRSADEPAELAGEKTSRPGDGRIHFTGARLAP